MCEICHGTGMGRTDGGAFPCGCGDGPDSRPINPWPYRMTIQGHPAVGDDETFEAAGRRWRAYRAEDADLAWEVPNDGGPAIRIGG